MVHQWLTTYGTVRLRVGIRVDYLKWKIFIFVTYEEKLLLLDDTAHFKGLLLDPAEGFGQGFFCHSGKKEPIMLFGPILRPFWCSVVTFVTFGSNLKEGFN